MSADSFVCVSGIYDSMQCKPTKGESRLLADMCTRPVLSVRDSMPLFGDGIEKRQRDDNGRRQWIAVRSLADCIDIYD